MSTMKNFLIFLAFAALCGSRAAAQSIQQETRRAPAVSQSVTVIIEQQKLRFTAFASAQEVRLEVFNQAGELVYDSGIITGAELSWSLRNTSGGEIPSGLYAYTLTIKETDSETLATRRGHLILERGRDQLWVTNQGAIGAEESPSGGELTVSSGAEASLAGARIGKDGAIVMAPNARPLEQVTHDATLTGDGTTVSPLGIADGGVTGRKIAAGQVVKSLNGLSDNVSLTAGTNITITPSGNSLNIAAPNLLGSVAHDTTLSGSGTSAAPLRISLPLFLSGSDSGAILRVTNVNSFGSGLIARGPFAVQAVGADNATAQAGWGVLTIGGKSISAAGGYGVQANGGDSDSGSGGTGIAGIGGKSIRGPGGFGGIAEGGNSDSGPGGSGLGTIGGRSISGSGGRGANLIGGSSDSGPGGDGVQTIGGLSNSNRAGYGAFLNGGNSDSGSGGFGVSAIGGNSNSGSAGGGVFGQGGSSKSSFSGNGVVGVGGNSDSVRGGDGIVGFRGLSPVGNGLAGLFFGDVNVNGNLSKGGGSFKIDHPLDPANKYLYHSFVESPDMMNVYNGNVTTDANGDATVTLPDYFQALNRDFRYQLTVIGQFAQAIVASKVNGNSFTIKTDRPGVEVSRQVTGVRQDAYANKHRIPVEEEKPERERGYYLHPKDFDQPEEKSLEWARNPEMMKQIKTRRQEAELRRREKENDR